MGQLHGGGFLTHATTLSDQEFRKKLGELCGLLLVVMQGGPKPKRRSRLETQEIHPL
jgi:hypothetical protein